eukprot:s1888_g9.t1
MDYTTAEDFYIPLFSGQPSEYKELKILDKAFEYDSTVQLPSDFDKYFSGLQRRPGQTLLDYTREHDHLYNNHGVTLPSKVQGWHLLRRAGLTREQRQLITTQAPSMERNKIQEALFLILGQDHKSVAGGGQHPYHRGIRGKGRGYSAFYEGEDNENYDHNDCWPDDDERQEEAGYYEGEDNNSPGADSYYDETYEDFDNDAAYYQTLGDTDPTEQAEEYDSAYATYLDARRRFNEIKLSRGYLPIVALTDGGSMSPGAATPHSPSPSASPGRGNGKSKKGKSKSKSKGRGKEPDPKGRAKAAGSIGGQPTCLRCGQVGHMTYNCPVPRGNSPPKRKAAPTESIVDHSESGHVTFTDIDGNERHDCAMLDPGASAFLSGYGPFLRYMLQLKETDYDITKVKFMKCHRTFYFGGDASLVCSWTVRLPLCIGGKYGYVQMYLHPGETPMLLGRPIMEALGLVLDCRSKMIKLDDMPWHQAVVGAHGEYLNSLLNEFDSSMWQFPPAFELMVPADGGTSGDFLDFQVFNNDTKLFDSDAADIQATAHLAIVQTDSCPSASHPRRLPQGLITNAKLGHPSFNGSLCRPEEPKFLEAFNPQIHKSCGYNLARISLAAPCSWGILSTSMAAQAVQLLSVNMGSHPEFGSMPQPGNAAPSFVSLRVLCIQFAIPRPFAAAFGSERSTQWQEVWPALKHTLWGGSDVLGEPTWLSSHVPSWPRSPSMRLIATFPFPRDDGTTSGAQALCEAANSERYGGVLWSGWIQPELSSSGGFPHHCWLNSKWRSSAISSRRPAGALATGRRGPPLPGVLGAAFRYRGLFVISLQRLSAVRLRGKAALGPVAAGTLVADGLATGVSGLSKALQFWA